MNTQFPVERILLGPGPSPVSSRVLRALAAPTLGHLDPQYLAILDETCEMLRQIFPDEKSADLSRERYRHGGNGMCRREPD